MQCLSLIVLGKSGFVFPLNAAGPVIIISPCHVSSHGLKPSRDGDSAATVNRAC